MEKALGISGKVQDQDMALWKNEEEARNQIKEMITGYYREYKKPQQEKPFATGDRIPYASRVYDEKEMCALTDAMLDFWLTAGRFCEEFEQKFAEWAGISYAHLTNSGSSANLPAPGREWDSPAASGSGSPFQPRAGRER